MSNEYIATYKTSRQISPDDWEVYNPSLKITDQTTIGEIRKWFTEGSIDPGKVSMEVKIIQLSAAINSTQ